MLSVVPTSCYFYYPRPVCVVAVRDDGVPTVNLTPITWATPLSMDPPLFGICLSPRTHSHALVLKTGEFAVAFLGDEHTALVAALGQLSGRSVDKVQHLRVQLTAPSALGTPWPAVAYAAVECALVGRHQLGDQTLLVGEIHAVHTVPGAFDGAGVLQLARASPLLYLGGGRYARVVPQGDPPVAPER